MQHTTSLSVAEFKNLVAALESSSQIELQALQERLDAWQHEAQPPG